MAVSASFRAFAVDQLTRVAGRVRARSMFGGVGIYSGELFFALISSDELYLKVDDSNRADYEARGIGPFRPRGFAGEAMPYYPVPADVLDDVEALEMWVGKAVAAAARKKVSGKKAGGKRAGRKRPGGKR